MVLITPRNMVLGGFLKKIPNGGEPKDIIKVIKNDNKCPCEDSNVMMGIIYLGISDWRNVLGKIIHVHLLILIK